MKWKRRSNNSDESGPSTGGAGSKKDSIDPKWKVRIQAIVLIGLLVIPGNLGTLLIYATSEPNTQGTLNCVPFFHKDLMKVSA